LTDKVLLFLLTMLVVLGVGSAFRRQEKTNFKRYPYLDLVLVSAAVNLLLHSFFFHYSNFIWSCNIEVQPSDFLPVMNGYAGERDGLEGYVLYALLLTGVFLTYLFYYAIQFLSHRKIYYCFLALLLLIVGLYPPSIGWNVPMKAVATTWRDFGFVLFVLVLIEGLIVLQRKCSAKWVVGIIALLLVPVCFIATAPIAVYDYSYIFFPAMKLLNGVPLTEIYFQYDLFLSLIAAFWLKLEWSVHSFQWLGQLSFLLYFIGIYALSYRLFQKKNLCIFLLICSVILRYYAVGHEPTSCFQVTPLRLDLWLVLLFLVFQKGMYHWSVGVFLGCLLVIHKNFGLIYLISYLELFLTLFFLEIFKGVTVKNQALPPLKVRMIGLLKHLLPNAVLITCFLIFSSILFEGFTPESALLYQKIGIGMMKITRNSMYWYFPILCSLTFILLLKRRNQLEIRYVSTGLLIVFLAAGNALYYFGRSHENNLLNISGALVLVVFLLLDVLLTPSQAPALRYKIFLRKTVPYVCLILCCFFYAHRSTSKLNKQVENIQKGQLQYPFPTKIDSSDLSAIRAITYGSKKVFFLNYYSDFHYYFFGNYEPKGYYLPLGAGFLRQEMIATLSELLNDDYYLVTNKIERVRDLLEELNCVEIASKSGYSSYQRKEGSDRIGK
jgi:hypothetical protein